VSSNKGITEIPTFINDLKNLIELDVSNCNIKNGFDVSSLTNLVLLLMDDNPELTQLPKNISECKSLQRITASCCNLEGLVDEILYLNNLYMIDVHNNPRLTYVPIDLTKMEKLIACNLDHTSVSDDVTEILSKNAISKKNKCSFVKHKEKNFKVKL
jgi:Leucine-rich repeat (LRR) protein